MNARLTFSTLLILALLLADASAAALLPEEGRSPRSASSPNRQIICDKIERIRFESVAYDGVPLGEIVNQLKIEALKRDTEKKGINFMINPNAPARIPGPGEGPVEAIDPHSITIHIKPALNNVRLVDVMDAIVKVADHPINYTIEDYGIVFALQDVVPPERERGEFIFPGGTPREFLDAVQKQYKVDWSSVADIPREMVSVRIPRLRIQAESLGPILQGREGGGPIGALVSLYNQLGEQKPELGRLIVKGDLAHPSVVLFAPDKSLNDAHAKIKVKAFTIYGLNDAEMKDLQEDIDRATREAMQYSIALGDSALRALEGRVATHKDTGLLVATGPESYVDMVESIVTATQAKHQVRISKPPTLPSTTTPR